MVYMYLYDMVNVLVYTKIIITIIIAYNIIIILVLNNLMILLLLLSVGAIAGDTSVAYLRPETAQGIFVNFMNVQRSARMKVSLLYYNIVLKGTYFDIYGISKIL